MSQVRHTLPTAPEQLTHASVEELARALQVQVQNHFSALVALAKDVKSTPTWQDCLNSIQLDAEDSDMQVSTDCLDWVSELENDLEPLTYIKQRDNDNALAVLQYARTVYEAIGENMFVRLGLLRWR